MKGLAKVPLTHDFSTKADTQIFQSPADFNFPPQLEQKIFVFCFTPQTCVFSCSAGRADFLSFAESTALRDGQYVSSSRYSAEAASSKHLFNPYISKSETKVNIINWSAAANLHSQFFQSLRCFSIQKICALHPTIGNNIKCIHFIAFYDLCGYRLI